MLTFYSNLFPKILAKIIARLLISLLIGVSQSNVSQHLALMRQRQIVKTWKLGTNIYYSVSNPKISQACDMVREVLIEQLRQKQELIKKLSGVESRKTSLYILKVV